jgi:hypothetical protein
MVQKSLLGLVVVGLLAIPGGVVAADEVVAPKVQKQVKEQVYGSQLMTRQERLEHRNKLRGAKTVEAREQIRKEHHEKMQQRAKERGVTLPDMPQMPRGGAMGPAGGMGSGGMGPKR